MQHIDLIFLNGADVERIALTDREILDSVETALDAQGKQAVVIEPRVHLVPHDSAIGHFNVLRGVVHPLALAGVKVVGDFVENFKRHLPSELGLLALFDPSTGVPLAIINATSLTEMRTGAMTACWLICREPGQAIVRVRRGRPTDADSRFPHICHTISQILSSKLYQRQMEL